MERSWCSWSHELPTTHTSASGSPPSAKWQPPLYEAYLILIGAWTPSCTAAWMHNLFLNPPGNEVFTCLLGSCPEPSQGISAGGLQPWTQICSCCDTTQRFFGAARRGSLRAGQTQRRSQPAFGAELQEARSTQQCVSDYKPHRELL